MSFDVTNQLQAAGISDGSQYNCGIYVKLPAVSISLSD